MPSEAWTPETATAEVFRIGVMPLDIGPEGNRVPRPLRRTELAAWQGDTWPVFLDPEEFVAVLRAEVAGQAVDTGPT